VSEEVWKPIDDTGYSVSDRGNVYSSKSRRNLKLVVTSNGYHQVTIKGKSCFVHRLVLYSFSRGLYSKYGLGVNHINGVKTDNTVANLEWCTQGENNRHARTTGLMDDRGVKNCNAVLDNDGVLEIKKLLRHFTPMFMIAKLFKVHPTTIRDIRNGKSWSWLKEDTI
tara:strand:+ start:1782 stop:2282 length:501 start_codon:yes stop_codon:yes gene_type:complete